MGGRSLRARRLLIDGSRPSGIVLISAQSGGAEAGQLRLSRRRRPDPSKSGAAEKCRLRPNFTGRARGEGNGGRSYGQCTTPAMVPSDTANKHRGQGGEAKAVTKARRDTVFRHACLARGTNNAPVC